jgi:hypothetical protein
MKYQNEARKETCISRDKHVMIFHCKVYDIIKSWSFSGCYIHFKDHKLSSTIIVSASGSGGPDMLILLCVVRKSSTMAGLHVTA